MTIWSTLVGEEQGGRVGAGETSGALPAPTFVSGTARQLDPDSPRFLCLNVTVASATTDTVKIELSPDGTTFTSLGTFLDATATGNTLYSVHVPAGWYVKVTLAGTAAITSAAYY